jgi:hypothetical protein
MIEIWYFFGSIYLAINMSILLIFGTMEGLERLQSDEEFDLSYTPVITTVLFGVFKVLVNAYRYTRYRLKL